LRTHLLDLASELIINGNYFFQLKMYIYFIDFQRVFNTIEICIMRDPFDFEYYLTPCQVEYDDESIYYALKEKIDVLSQQFPMMKLLPYSKHLQLVPENIKCVSQEHGHDCAYKRVLSMCVEYFK